MKKSLLLAGLSVAVGVAATLAPAVLFVQGDGFVGWPENRWWGYPFGWLYPRNVLWVIPPGGSPPSRVYAVTPGTPYEVIWEGLIGNIAVWSVLAAIPTFVGHYLVTGFRRRGAR